MKTFKENQLVYYILFRYDDSLNLAVPYVMCYEWHENLRNCFNEALLFDNKEDAIKLANELGNATKNKVF